MIPVGASAGEIVAHCLRKITAYRRRSDRLAVRTEALATSLSSRFRMAHGFASIEAVHGLLLAIASPSKGAGDGAG